jgi:hypothetical protein
MLVLGGMEPLVEEHALCELDVALQADASDWCKQSECTKFQLDLVQTHKIHEFTQYGIGFYSGKET